MASSKTSFTRSRKSGECRYWSTRDWYWFGSAVTASRSASDGRMPRRSIDARTSSSFAPIGTSETLAPVPLHSWPLATSCAHCWSRPHSSLLCSSTAPPPWFRLPSGFCSRRDDAGSFMSIRARTLCMVAVGSLAITLRRPPCSSAGPPGAWQAAQIGFITRSITWTSKKELSQLGGGAEAGASASTPLPLTPAPLTLALPEKPPPAAFPDHLRVTPLAFVPRSRALLPAVRPFTRYWPRMVTLSALSDSVPLTSGDPDRDPTTATWPLGRSNVP